MNRIERESDIVVKMIGIYCRKHHGLGEGCICEECRDLADYAVARISKCPKGDRKTSCRKCEIHCYAPRYRSRIREVMRYVGPRMIIIDPLAAIRHLISEMK